MATSTKAKTSSGRDYSVSSNPKVTAINKARATNIDKGKSAYSGAGATQKSASLGKGGYEAGGDYSDLPSFDKAPTGVAPVETQNAPQSDLTPEQAKGFQSQIDTARSQISALQPTAPTSAAAPTPTQSKYQEGLTALQAAGVPPPADAGAARSGMAAYVPDRPDTTAVDTYMAEDPQVTSLMTEIDTLLNPKKQVSSLMDDYKKIRKESGLDRINQEMIDAETVINGTEDAIRNEIQTAGGFGTESQIQSMAIARNKGLLLKYNALAQQQTNATSLINNLMQFSQQDKQMAQERINTAITAKFNLANFRQTALSHSREQYQWLATQMGADGLYNSLSQDPRQLAFAEKILGVPSGGLNSLAEQARITRANTESDRMLDRSYKQAQINNLNAPKAPKPATGAERDTLAFFNRAFQASKDVAATEDAFASNPGKAAGLGLIGLLQTNEQRSYKQAQRAFTEARLRKESGAAIPNEEYAADAKTYFVQPGDDTAAINQKQKARAQVLEGLRYASGTAYNEFYGENAVDKIEVDGNTYYVGEIVKNGEGQTGVVLPDGSIETR